LSQHPSRKNGRRRFNLREAALSLGIEVILVLLLLVVIARLTRMAFATVFLSTGIPLLLVAIVGAYLSGRSKG